MLYVRVYIVPQFCKISFIVIIFDRCLCQRRFLQGLQWVLLGFSVCSARFLVRSGGFLLWFLWERSRPTFARNTVIERVIKFFCVCKLDCKSLNAFGLKNCQRSLTRWKWKRKEIFRMLLGQIIAIWSNGHGRTRGFHALDNSCNFLLRWWRQIKRNIRFLWFGHCKHFHAIYTFQCVRK